MMSHSHHNGGMRISPQSIPQPSHLQPSMIPISSAPSIIPQTSSAQSSSNMQQSPLRSPSPDKKSVDLNVESSDELTKDPTTESVSTDIRTNSIAALRIKAKEHLENINKNLTMV